MTRVTCSEQGRPSKVPGNNPELGTWEEILGLFCSDVAETWELHHAPANSQVSAQTYVRKAEARSAPGLGGGGGTWSHSGVPWWGGGAI